MNPRTTPAFPGCAFTGLAIAAACLLGSAAPASAQPSSKPHILYILADDLGWKDVGFHGSDIRTPTIDALAAGGTRLEQFYTQPMCTPTRAALMTGRYPFRYGLQSAAIPSASRYGLSTEEWLLPQALKSSGYTTAIVGKWHLGHARREYWPRQRGFDYQYGALLGEIDYFSHQAHGTTDWFRDNEAVNEEGYVTELLGNDAVRLVRSHDPAKPLFLYLTFTAPHAPYQAPSRYLDRYDSIEDPARRAYAGMVSAMDDQIARVLAALEERGMRENTLVVFHSDNGGPRSSEFTGEVDTSGIEIPSDNGPYRDGKGSLYEGGTRVVSLLNWPGRIRAGTVTKQPLHVVDMFPTLARLAGVDGHRGKPLDGVDAWPAIVDGKATPRREVVYNIEPFVAGLRRDQFKLVWRVPLPSRAELFDLSVDPGEKTDVSAAHPETVAALQRRAQELAGEATPPLLLKDMVGAARTVLLSSVALPDDEAGEDQQP